MSPQRKAGAAFFILAAALFSAQTKPAAPAAYTDPANHFSLNAPDFGPVKTSVVPVMFTGASENGFSPNVNVLIQMTKVTRKEFIDKMLAEFKTYNAKINSQKELQVSGHDAAILDYQATLQGHDLHFLALVVVGDDRVYLVTCTALATDYAAQEAHFKECVNSFKLTGN